MIQNSLINTSQLTIAAGLAAAVFIAGLPGTAQAQDTNDTNWATGGQSQPVDKSMYNLFNMAPAEHLRPLVADANDGVSDPTTVDAGHAEIQGSLVDYYYYSTTYAHGTVNFSESTFNWAPRVSVGLLDNVELFVHPYFYAKSYTYSGAYNASHDSSGYDGINIGTKINVWGNEDGTTALAMAPYLSISRNGDLAGGADIPFAVRLPDQFYLKLDVTPYLIDHGGDSYYFGVGDGLSVHKGFGDKLDTYAYVNTTWTSDGVEWYGYAGFGLGYNINPDLEVFMGIGFGLTDNSYDYNPRLGLAWRF